MTIQFSLTEEQTKRANKWIKQQGFCAQGTIGGQFTFSFTSTSLGVVQKVINNANGKELDLTEYDEW